jgi:predicted kinase
MNRDLRADDLLATMHPEAGLVVLMCGMAGSGKTTFSQRLEAKGFTRLSIDEEVWQRFGRYGVDYPPGDYRSLLDIAHAHQRDQLTELMTRKVPTVIDSAFWNRADRDEHKALVEQGGCRWQLIYLKTPIEVIRWRLQGRNQRFDANAAFQITEDILARYSAAFEEPIDEGAIAVVP